MNKPDETAKPQDPSPATPHPVQPATVQPQPAPRREFAEELATDPDSIRWSPEGGEH